MIISVVCAGLFIVNIWRRGWVLPVIAVGLWGFISIVVGTLYPAVHPEASQVKPNEFTKEQPYIKRNITATRSRSGSTTSRRRRTTTRRTSLPRSSTAELGDDRQHAALGSRSAAAQLPAEPEAAAVLHVHEPRSRSVPDRRPGARGRRSASASSTRRSSRNDTWIEPASRVHARIRRRRRRPGTP